MADEDSGVVTALDRRRVPRPLSRIAVLSIHTSPFEQPGVGDAGGMNVYIDETTRRLAEAGVACEVFTRATSSQQPPMAELAPGVTIRHITAGPFEGLRKGDLPGQLCAMTAGVLRAEAARSEGWFDLVHSHYWLSGQVGWLASERWGIPLVHSMHTMAKVKNAELALGDVPEPVGRVIGEEQVVAAASRLIANTAVEAEQLVRLYDADPTRVDVVHPGVDLEHFRPADRLSARTRVGIPADALLLLFVGRIQPLKAPDIVIEAAARVRASRPDLAKRLTVVICGGPSGTGLDRPEALIDLTASLGMTDTVRFEPPGNRTRLRDWYQAADLVLVPSYSESFGLVAVEAQACGVPVVAADVGGLRTAVDDGRSGVLISGHDPQDYADVVARLLDEPARRAEMAIAARRHAENFSWTSTTAGLITAYRAAIDDQGSAAPLSRRA